jgi:hypothetical protein
VYVLVGAVTRGPGRPSARRARLNTWQVSFWAVPVRRLVVSGKSRPKGGDMTLTHRQINQRVQAAREQAIIRYVYGKRS